MEIDDLIAAFGGPNDMAAALGLTHSHITYWRKVGYIPLKRHDQVAGAALQFKVAVSKKILLEQYRRISPRPLGGRPTARTKSAEVLALSASGIGPKEIAARLGISYSSVMRIRRADKTKRKRPI